MCMAVHPSGVVVATADSAAQIHLWSTESMSCIGIIDSIVQQGVRFLQFSPVAGGGDRLATVGMDDECTLVVYALSQSQASVVSMSKGPGGGGAKDVAYSPDGRELLVVGVKKVVFYLDANGSHRSLKTMNGRLGHLAKRQTFMCAAYMGPDDDEAAAEHTTYCTELRKNRPLYP